MCEDCRELGRGEVHKDAQIAVLVGCSGVRYFNEMGAAGRLAHPG